jgi:DNA invertase Pin-like site-specific DNA recombinase
MIFGYFRRIDRDGDSAPAVLRAERCLRVESEEVGRRDARTQLIAAMANGDVLVSPSIAHLAVSVSDLLRVVGAVHDRGATLRLVAEKVDTSVAGARNALVALADFNRRQLAERRQAGLRQAELDGGRPGRPRKLDDSMVRSIRDEIEAGGTHAAAARALGVHPTTVMRLLRRAEERCEGEE